tara:strand:+ start:506 stop:733 length:228 start_codon:yes stop_codon:yes gene_type:complete
MSYPNQPQNDGDVDIIWEYPEDDWISMGEHCDMNMWRGVSGRLFIAIYPVYCGKTDTCRPLATYEVKEFDSAKGL